MGASEHTHTNPSGLRHLGSEVCAARWPQAASLSSGQLEHDGIREYVNIGKVQ